jgi:diacylglycerol kinase family enzyme
MLATMKRAALVVNPFASGVSEESLGAVEGELRRGLDLTVALTEHPRHATELARGLSDVELVFVYGGDGLLNEVLNGLGRGATVGVLPGGRTNVVARTLGVPLDPVEAARVLPAGTARPITLGRANGRRFAFAAGLGFDAELVRRVDELGRRSDGRRPGDLAFVWEAAKLLAGRRGRYEPAVEIDGFGRVAFALVANTDPYSYAAGRPLHIAPTARFELGLDLVAPRSVRPASIPRLLRYILSGDGHDEAGDIVYAHDLDRVLLRADEPLPLQLDGEDLGDVDEVVFEAERGAVAMLVPAAGTLTA